jgi:hypothetical protein
MIICAVKVNVQVLELPSFKHWRSVGRRGAKYLGYNQPHWRNTAVLEGRWSCLPAVLNHVCFTYYLSTIAQMY